MALDPITAGIDLGKTLIDKFFPDAGEVERRKLEAMMLVASSQAEINKVEAASNSVFVAGWRPFIGWVCGMALVYSYLLYPLLVWGAAIASPAFVPPALEVDDILNELLFALLGLGALRTVEKVKGVTR